MGANDYFYQVALNTSVDAIPPLNNNNYSVWQHKMMMLFDFKDIKDAITRNLGQLPVKQD